MNYRTCIRCHVDFSTIWRQLLCNACKLLPKPSRMPGIRKHETFYISEAFKNFMEAHPSLVWFPRENAVMSGGGAYGWITGLDDHGGPSDPVGIGFFRSKANTGVTVLLNDDRRTVRFEPRCWATTRKRRIRLKRWENWMAAAEVCPCNGCLAHKVLTELAEVYYSDHINNDEVTSTKES